MSGGFLRRWSARKAAAREGEPTEAAPPPPAPAPAAPAPGEAAPEPVAGGAGGSAAVEGQAPAELPAVPCAADPELALPDLASLTQATDIRPFLRPGVPALLRQAALQKMWSLDPAIKDFREMADYDWDFNTPGGAPGYGPLESTFDQIEGMLARILPPAPKPEADPAPGPEGAPPEPDPAPAPLIAEAPPQAAPAPSPAVRLSAAAPADPAPVPEPAPEAVPPRRHGGAVPV